jgi:hypothetical protein
MTPLRSVILGKSDYKTGKSLGATRGETPPWRSWIVSSAMPSGTQSSIRMCSTLCPPPYQIIAQFSCLAKVDRDGLVPSSLKTSRPSCRTSAKSWLLHGTVNSEHHEPFHKLYHKPGETAKALRKWSNFIISDAKLQLHIALEIILRLDLAQERWQLSEGVLHLRETEDPRSRLGGS